MRHIFSAGEGIQHTNANAVQCALKVGLIWENNIYRENLLTLKCDSL